MAKRLKNVADVQLVHKIIIKLRGTVAISGDYPHGGEVNQPLINTTMAAWTEEMGTALKTAGKEPPVHSSRLVKNRAG